MTSEIQKEQTSLATWKKELLSRLFIHSSQILFVTIVLALSLIVYARVSNGQEVVDYTKDNFRLELISFQSLSFETTGEYTQIKNKNVVEGDTIGFEASIKNDPANLALDYEVHVYEAPCGRGWLLKIYDRTNLVESLLLDENNVQFTSYLPTIRTYAYGCEHERTFNW